MSEVYRKRGRVVRYENGTLVRVVECGIAVETGDLFECHPERSEGPAALADDRVLAIADQLKHLPLERLIIQEGLADHECGDVRWSEESRRIHISLVKDKFRVLLDLGSFDFGDVHRVAAALERAESTEREAPKNLRLAPNVTAAILPHLRTSIQSAGGLDGKGQPIIEARGHWPNWYRPSYRVRPTRMPLNLRADCEVTEIDASLPIAVALLAPIERHVAHVLIDDGTRVYPARPRITSLRAAAPPRTWYPYGGGAWGAESLAGLHDDQRAER